MIYNNHLSDEKWQEYLLYLYSLAEVKYRDADDMDALVMDSLLVLLTKLHDGGEIGNPKAFLSGVMKNKYNEFLRKKYKNRVVFFGDIHTDNADGGVQNLALANPTDTEDETYKIQMEYENTRREIGRLIKIYREVTVRHYLHGHPVERIAHDLDISVGTVKSRLSSARHQIKEGLKNMEKYSDASYEPKKVWLGIWGSAGLSREPFSLLSSPIEGNILWLAYSKPISVRSVADTLGMPTAYLEPIIDRLIRGELMGRTEGGLIYTRCFMQKAENALGDVAAEEELADKNAEKLWSALSKKILPLTEREEFIAMTDKQKATLILYAVHEITVGIIFDPEFFYRIPYDCLPERPNGGRWLALARVGEYDQKLNPKYNSSGPAQVQCNEDSYRIEMQDYQSVFGDTHFRYGEMKYKCSVHNAARLIASFIDGAVRPDNDCIYELVPDFEKLHILRKDDSGKTVPDIPILSFEEKQLWDDAVKAAKDEIFDSMHDEIASLLNRFKNNVPERVDFRESFLHEGALGAYTVAQMLAVVNKGLIPYPVKIGETPIIVMSYRKI